LLQSPSSHTNHIFHQALPGTTSEHVSYLDVSKSRGIPSYQKHLPIVCRNINKSLTQYEDHVGQLISFRSLVMQNLHSFNPSIFSQLKFGNFKQKYECFMDTIKFLNQRRTPDQLLEATKKINIQYRKENSIQFPPLTNLIP
jgi:hypothetical protein